jgi:hypothetical protein
MGDDVIRAARKITNATIIAVTVATMKSKVTVVT